MKYILVQFQGGKDKLFSGKFYIYKYNEEKINHNFNFGDIVEHLTNSSGYNYRNKAILAGIFNSYEDYVFYQKVKNEGIYKREEIKELVTIDISAKAFIIGDRVRIHKPSNVTDFPIWTSSMDQFDGRIGEITNMGREDMNNIYYYIDNERFKFSTNWLEKTKEPKFKPGDKVVAHRPRINNISPIWVDNMDTCELSVFTIEKSSFRTDSCIWVYTVNEVSYKFQESWLERAEEYRLKLHSKIACYEAVSAKLAVQGTNLPPPYEGFATKINETKESEGNKMDFSNILNVEFGKINDSYDVAASMYGIAIRGNDNRYRAYDKANGKIIDVTGMTFNSDMLFKIPCAISQISVGDVIINAGNYVTVTNVHKDGTFTVVDPRASEQKIAIPAKNMFGFDFMTKVFYPLDSFIKPTDDNPFGLNPMAMMLLASDEDMDMSTLVLMTMMGNGATNQNMMLPMILMMNKNGRSSDMSTLALAMMMGQTNILDMSNRCKYTYKHPYTSNEVESYQRALENSPVPEPIYDDVSDVPDAINPCAD